MISIRAHLLCTLLPAFAGISVAASFGVYYSTKAELTARLDARLANLAIDLQFAPPGTERPPQRGRFNEQRFNERGKPARGGSGGVAQLRDNLFTNLPSNVFCEVRMGDREVVLKTDNLRGRRIARPEESADDPVFYDSNLSEGPALRAWASTLAIKRGGRDHEVLLAVDREEEDATLARLARDLVGGAIACCLILSLLLILALRVSLKPLRRLGEQAAGMGAESLHERFAEKSAPSDIRPIVERLNDLMARLEESFARERRFSGDLAHELRTPLAAIRANAEVAMKWPEQASTEDYEEIHQLATDLQQTLESLLSLARMESSAAESARETTRVARVAEECVALHAAKAAERGLEIQTRFEPDATVETDPSLLRLIMTNLIGNAVDYAPDGGVVTIAAGGSALFECANAAPNLAADDVEHLFERMWRKDAARTEANHAGLGLSIAKASAEALGLRLEAALDANGELRFALRS